MLGWCDLLWLRYGNRSACIHSEDSCILLFIPLALPWHSYSAMGGHDALTMIVPITDLGVISTMVLLLIILLWWWSLGSDLPAVSHNQLLASLVVEHPVFITYLRLWLYWDGASLWLWWWCSFSHGCGSLLVLWWRWLLLMVAPALLVMASSVAMAAVEYSIIEAAYLAMMVASSFTCW